jgi:hypothetical protein
VKRLANKALAAGRSMLGTGRRGTITFVGIAAVCAVLALVGGCSQKSETGIAGSLRLVSLFGGTDPWPGQKVVVFSSQGSQPMAQTTTDSAGRFFFALKPGTYRIETHTGQGIGGRSSVSVTDVSLVDGRPGKDARTDRHLRRFGRGLAERLGLARQSAEATFYGTSADGARRLFGDNAPSGSRHVWVYVLRGKPTPASPRNAWTQALRRGGYVAFELDATTFDVLATVTANEPWQLPPWVHNHLWGPEFGAIVW